MPLFNLMMRIYYLLLLISGLILGCSQNSGSGPADNTPNSKTRKWIIPVVEKYIMGQLPDAKKTISGDGIITIGNEQKRYVLEPSKIFTGLINDDQKKDAIVSLATFQGQYETVSEQLIILNTGRDFTLAQAIESDMRIISIKDRIITADVPEHSRSTPLFNCPSCWEVLKYQFKMGELVRMEQMKKEQDRHINP
jgi:hypothetical protein